MNNLESLTNFESSKKDSALKNEAENSLNDIIKKLDLSEFLASFMEHFSREKKGIDIALKSEKNHIFSLLCEFEKLDLNPLPHVKNLDDEIAKLKKFGILDIDQIFEFISIIRYFIYLKNGANNEQKTLFSYLEKIEIPNDLLKVESVFLTPKEIAKNFNNFKLKSGIYEEIDSILSALSHIKNDIKTAFVKIFSSQKLAPFFVDRQIHLVNETESLLLKAGFQNALEGSIVSRSATGFFYVLPTSIQNLISKQKALNERLLIALFEVAKNMSATLQKHTRFLEFINKEFDKIDSILARINFAKTKNLNFAYEPKFQKDSVIILSEFCHPNLKNPKPLSVNFSGGILMVTGVNAGGKTMLLKSILSAVFLNKFLLPMRINSAKSKLPNFSQIFAVIADPQNSKNDISTFAGRMLSFSKILHAKNALLGIDEIELGTDADEASALYKILLENLLKNNSKIVVTTHHKRLAQLLAKNPQTQMLAAIFDEEKMLPTYEFLDGAVGKSYAFETALRYGIAKPLINAAKELYGSDKERLNYLIENAIKLELELKNKSEILSGELESLRAQKEQIAELKERLKEQNLAIKNRLEMTYQNALKELQNIAKNASQKEIHQSINRANKILESRKNLEAKSKKILSKNTELKVGDFIKYNEQKGRVESVKNKSIIVALESGIRLKTSIENVEKITHKLPKSTPKTSINFSVNAAKISLDLHGKRGDEALDLAAEFIDNALLAGFDSVLIYHGIGTGRLSMLIKDFLKSHPKVVRFEDAPPNQGGFGAKIIYL